MNIGEIYYCSKCMRQIREEGVCPYCGYDPGDAPDKRFLEEGTLLHEGRYQLGAVIGQGGFGITYAAWDLTLEIPIAIKEYFPYSYADRNVNETDELSVHADMSFYYLLGLQTFVREARILATLQSIRTVVKVFDFFEENKTAYIIMEYVRGRTLGKYCEQEKIKSKQLLKMLKPTIDDLILVHKSGVLHRDISPENLLIQDEGIIKLIDFGAATSISKENDKNYVLNQNFAAPEQFELEGRQGFWTDVYGLAATLYSVFSGKRIQSAPARQEKDRLKFFAKTKTPIGFLLRRSLRLGLILNVEKRTQTMEEFRANLYHLPKPIVTRKQKMMFLAKVLILYLAATSAYVAVLEMIDQQIPIQMILAAECYLKKDTDNALDLADNYKAGRSGKEGFYRDYSKSMYWYKWAADQGNPKAMFQYALELDLGEITEKDISSAVTYYEKAAEAEIPMAWNNLGVIYLNGDGVEKNIEKAVMCFQRASEYGIPLSFCNLGFLYESGQGVNSDIEKAVNYYKRAAEAGEVIGMYRLAICYGTGNGVEQSDILCLKYLYESACGGCPEAMCEIGHIYETGDLGYTDYDMAFNWYDKACEMDYGGGYYGESLMYRDGIGVDLDEETACYFMQRAADLKFEPAYKELIKMAENRYGIFEDDNIANKVLSDYEQYR